MVTRESQLILLELTNAERAKVGRHPLAFHPALLAAAQKHAEWMYSTVNFSHYGPNSNTWIDRARAEGYPTSGVGENIAAGQRSPQHVIDAWMNSSGHRETMLSDRYHTVGFGMAGNYWCGVYGTALPEQQSPTPTPVPTPKPQPIPVPKFNIWDLLFSIFRRR